MFQPFLVRLLVAGLACVPFTMAAQQIRGTVRDALTRQPLAFCSVVPSAASTGIFTDQRGQFSLHLSASGNRTLVLTFTGYSPDTVQVPTATTYVEIMLKPVSSTLGNVVVTGVSRATLARENPLAILSVPSGIIERSAESNLIDVLVKNVPGLSAVKTGPNVSKPFIRGLGYNRVLTLYDGIRQEGQQWGDEHGIEVDAYNIEKAEVIKGPASIMYGSDALAGVVSLIPFAVTEEGALQGRWISEYHTNNGLTGNGVRLAGAGSRWTWLAAGSYRLAKDYRNQIDGRVYNTGFRETNISAGLRYKGESRITSINVTLYNNLQGIPDGSRDSITRRFTRQVGEGGLDSLKLRPVVPDSVLRSYRLSPLHQHIRHYRLYGNQHLETSAGDLDLQLALQQNIRREYNHPAFPKQAGMFVRLNTVNYGARFNLLPLNHTEFSFGVNGMYQRNRSIDATDFPIPDYHLLDAGAYVFAKWKKKEWSVSSGLRYDLRYLEGNDFYTRTDASTGFLQKASGAGTPGARLQFPAFNKMFSGISVSVGVTYQLNESVSLKANIARGYRAPGINEFASNGLDPGAHIIYLGNRSFLPEFSLQEDLGADIHTTAVSLSVSLFNNHVQRYIYLSQVSDANGNVLLDAQGNRTYQYRQAAAQLYGAEAMLNLHPASWKGFLFGNAFSAIYGYNRASAFSGKGTAGAYLPLIPPLRWISSLSQTIPVRSSVFEPDIKVEWEYNAAQNRYLALDNTETATPAYALVNVSLGTKLHYGKSKTLLLQVQAGNLFNTACQSNLSRLKYLEYYNRVAGEPSGIYNMGRNVSMKVVVPF